MEGSLRVVNVDIANGQSLGEVFALSDALWVGIIMPGTWTAADLTLQACLTAGGTYLNVYDDADNEVTIQAGASRHIIFSSPEKYNGVGPYIKVRSGTAGVAVAQLGDRVLQMLVRQQP